MGEIRLVVVLIFNLITVPGILNLVKRKKTRQALRVGVPTKLAAENHCFSCMNDLFSGVLVLEMRYWWLLMK